MTRSSLTQEPEIEKWLRERTKINGLPKIPVKPAPARMARRKYTYENRTRPAPRCAGVYVLRRLDLELFKIGCSRNLRARIREVQLSIDAFTTLECKVLWTYPHSLEAALHRHFEAKRVTGEWFRLDAADLDWLAKLDPQSFLTGE